MVYGGSAAQTPVPIGTRIPAPTNTAAAIELTLHAPSEINSNVYYSVRDLATQNTVTGYLSGTPGTALPANTTGLAIHAFRINNATASAVGIDILGIHLESES
jgi:hypothetical protein